MSVRSSKSRTAPDSLLALRNTSDVVLTSSPSETMILDQITAFWSEAGNQSAELQAIAVRIDVLSISPTGTYTAALEASADISFASPVTLQECPLVGTGTIALACTKDALEGFAYVRVFMTLGGSSPALQYNSYLDQPLA